MGQEGEEREEGRIRGGEEQGSWGGEDERRGTGRRDLRVYMHICMFAYMHIYTKMVPSAREYSPRKVAAPRLQMS